MISSQCWEATWWWNSSNQKSITTKSAICIRKNKLQDYRNVSKLTTTIEGLESSPRCGWVTYAPNIIVGLSLTKGILLDSASTKTVFLPPTYSTQTIYSRAPTHRNVKEVLCNTYLYINFKRNICKILFAHFKDMFRETTLGYQTKISLTYTL